MAKTEKKAKTTKTAKATKTTKTTKTAKAKTSSSTKSAAKSPAKAKTAKKAVARAGKRTVSGKKQRAEARPECRIESCKQPKRAKGYCRKHYKKWRQGAYGKARFTACVSNDCHVPMAQGRRGYCEEHFKKFAGKKGVGVSEAAESAPEEQAAAS